VTRSPVWNTILALIPLVALGWPLAKVISPSDKLSVVTELPIASNPTRRADLAIRTAHPFTSVTITVGEASWTFSPEEEEKELHIPLPPSGELHLLVSAIWPDGTPETAILLELMPDGLEPRTSTVWGEGEALEEITFNWDLE